jgi:hypothetical protein
LTPFATSKPTLSAHFTVLREALLVFASALDLNLKPRRASTPAGKPAARRS